MDREPGDTCVVAAAQIACRPGDVAFNLGLHREAIAQARRRGADLVVFPELSLTDYESAPDTARLARGRDCPELAGLAAFGRGLAVVVGFIERARDGRVFNAAALLEGGRVAHVHRKVNLPSYGRLVETRHYEPGTDIRSAGTALGRLACLVCADTWNPALPWLAALGGAEMMAVPAASSHGAVSDAFDSREGWRLNLRHTAMTYGMPIVMTNHCGPRRPDGLDFRGGSTVVGPTGRILAEAGDGPELLLAEIDGAAGAAARAELPTMRDCDPGLVGREIARILSGDHGMTGSKDRRTA